MDSTYQPLVEPIDDELIRWASEYICTSFGIFPDTVNNKKHPFISSGVPKDMLDTFVSQSLTEKSLTAFKIVLGMDVDEDIADDYVDIYKDAVPRLYPADEAIDYSTTAAQRLFELERVSIPLYHCGDISFKTYLSSMDCLMLEPLDDADDVFKVTGFKPVDAEEGTVTPGYNATAYIEAPTPGIAVSKAGYILDDDTE